MEVPILCGDLELVSREEATDVEIDVFVDAVVEVPAGNDKFSVIGDIFSGTCVLMIQIPALKLANSAISCGVLLDICVERNTMLSRGVLGACSVGGGNFTPCTNFRR